jgi:hypothetical protein
MPIMETFWAMATFRNLFGRGGGFFRRRRVYNFFDADR